MRSHLIVNFIVEPFHCRVFDRSVHPLDLAVSSWVVGLGQSMHDAVGFANHIKAHRPVFGAAKPKKGSMI